MTLGYAAAIVAAHASCDPHTRPLGKKEYVYETPRRSFAQQICVKNMAHLGDSVQSEKKNLKWGNMGRRKVEGTSGVNRPGIKLHDRNTIVLANL